jgi:hypothetical protein
MNPPGFTRPWRSTPPRRSRRRMRRDQRPATAGARGSARRGLTLPRTPAGGLRSPSFPSRLCCRRSLTGCAFCCFSGAAGCRCAGGAGPWATPFWSSRVLKQFRQMRRAEILEAIPRADFDRYGLGRRLAADVAHQCDRFQASTPLSPPIDGPDSTRRWLPMLTSRHRWLRA